MKRLCQISICFTIVFTVFFQAQVIEQTKTMVINPQQSTVLTRIPAPQGYTWEVPPQNSFAEFLVNFKLKPEAFPVRDYSDNPISKQYHHAAVFDIDVGNKDLQQCADAWMRLYGEYLWQQKRFDEIAFEFTSRQKLAWNDFKKGMRTTEIRDSVRFRQSGKYDDSYKNFRQYLNLIFRYAGTISLDRETVTILKNSDIQVGDIILKPGSPGHSVFVVGIAKNTSGKRAYLLAQSFMPAQDIHVIKNHENRFLSPWYQLDVNAKELRTAKYLFKPFSIKRFKGLKF